MSKEAKRVWHKMLDSFHDFPDIMEHCGACSRKPMKRKTMTFPCSSGHPACNRCLYAKQLKREGWCF